MVVLLLYFILVELNRNVEDAWSVLLLNDAFIQCAS